MYEDEFELTFQVPEEESAPEPLAAPAAKPAAPVEPVADEPTRIMTLGKTAAPAVDEPTRVITLEKPAEPPAPEQPAEPAPEPVKERPAPAAPAAARRVLISGGDRGIGAAAARAFAAAGYQVAVLYHQNAAAAAALEQQLPGCIAIQCDVASRASCELAFHAVEQAMGRVDVLVCNAGIAQQKLFTDITPEEWQRMLDVNLSGAFHLCQLALPGMIRRKQGRILTVSSMWGQTGGSCEVHYSAAKAGLIGLTKALAKEEGPSGITVNCVAPGVIETDMMAAFTAEDKAALAEETPVGRLGTPEEVAKLLVFLAGEDAGYITGQVFGVNGGLVI
ncbi:MAG: 3-oxoacyl-ACP reductase FabG [Faecalibacterium sp.]|nr:3-oxoacyl-ACP reductase FabG [Faecalibacterium sp.]